MMCSICHDAKATNKCNTCLDYFCDKCAGLHAKVFAGTFHPTQHPNDSLFTEIRNAPDNKL